MTVMKKILQESKDNKKIIGIRLYRDDEKFWCGYINDFTENLVLIQHFTEFGQSDGFIIEKIENIESIDNDDNYSSAHQYLIENQNDIKRESIKIDIPTSENWQHDILEIFINNNQIISMDFEGDFTIYGEIESLDSEFIKIKTVGYLGYLDGYSTYRLNDIIAIRIDNIESIKRKKLLEFNLKNNSYGKK